MWERLAVVSLVFTCVSLCGLPSSLDGKIIQTNKYNNYILYDYIMLWIQLLHWYFNCLWLHCSRHKTIKKCNGCFWFLQPWHCAYNSWTLFIFLLLFSPDSQSGLCLKLQRFCVPSGWSQNMNTILYATILLVLLQNGQAKISTGLLFHVRCWPFCQIYHQSRRPNVIFTSKINLSDCEQ